MFNSVLSLCKLNTFLTKRNFEIYFRAGKTNIFSVFHVEDSKNSVNVMVLWGRVIWVKNQTFSTIYVRFL